tara:strand:- start:154 stop:435 length:282 start_codon:yes stop_codon:yes gene_type:complete
MDYHKSIRAIHSEVVTIDGDTEKTIVALDKDNKEVTIDWTKVKAWKDPNEYQYKREQEYPLIQDQLDEIYHHGIDGWKKTIKTIKDKYPKDGS